MDSQLDMASVRLPLEDAVDSLTSLLEILTKFRKGKLKPAPHQRAFIWDKAKRQSYVQRFKDHGKPLGIFATYQLTMDDDRTVYLNDGRQRLGTLSAWLDDPMLHAFSRIEDVEDLLSAPRVTQQHRHYPNHMEAMVDFQDHNKGTALTAAEYYYGYMSNLADWERLWKQRYEAILLILADGLKRLTSKTSTARITVHKMNRHTLSLFHRWFTVKKDLRSYPVAQAQYSNKIPDKISIEYLMSDYFRARTPTQADKDIKDFERMITNEVALLEHIFRQELGIKTSFNETVVRWLLDVAIACRNNNIPVRPREEFLRKFLTHSRGQVVFPNFNDATRNATVGLARLQDVDRYSRALDCALFDEKWQRKKRSTANIPAGMHISHVHSIAHHGENDDVFLEPALRNLSRGSEDV